MMDAAAPESVRSNGTQTEETAAVHVSLIPSYACLYASGSLAPAAFKIRTPTSSPFAMHNSSAVSPVNSFAAERGSPMLRAVLEAGANPSAANEFTGETALELCIAKGDEVGVRILKAAGAKDPEA